MPADDTTSGATVHVQRREPTHSGTSLLVDVRAAGHTTFDRVVFQFAGHRPGHTIDYVPRIIDDATGEPIGARGRAFVQVTLMPAAAHDDNGHATAGALPPVSGSAALRDIVGAGDFEAVLTHGIGIAARTPFVVGAFEDPPRIAVDITHEPPGTGDELLRRGDSGAAVATWQWRLRLTLGRPVPVDEDFGPMTETATRDFQRERALTVDGIVGPRSRSAMERVLGI